MNAEFPEKLEFLFQPKRIKVAYGGRGGAKSWGFARALLILAAQNPIRILCTREIQKSIKDSVHKLLSDQIEALGLGHFYEILETTIRGANGSEFSFAGLQSHTVNSIKSFEGVDVCWVEEAQTVSKRSWDILLPTIRKPGSEIWISFNPDLDTDETYKRFVTSRRDDSIVVHINADDNPWLSDELKREREQCRITDPEGYKNIWEGKCKAVVDGAIYHNEMLAAIEGGRIRPVPHDPMLKVHTIWDLGWNDCMSIILVQRSSSELRIIDYIEDSHRTLADYVAQLRQRSYNWGSDWLPHDGETKNIQTGKSAKEVLISLGRAVQITPKLDIETGIKAARLVFPRVYFDDTKTDRLVQCLKRYRRAINQITNEPGAPLHDEYSHGADAFRYLCVNADKLNNEDWYEEDDYDDYQGRSAVGGY